MRRARALILLFLLCNAAPALATRSRPLDPSAEWWRLALRLTGESDEVRVGALRALRKLPRLEDSLRGELAGPRRFLALDVISALKLRTLLGDVLAAAERDDSGTAYSTVNALMTDADRPRVVEAYRRRALAGDVAPASRMVLLDTLARMNELLSPTELGKLLRDPSPEVRGSALHSVRHALVTLGIGEYLPLATAGFDTNPRQLRMQALYLLREYSDGGRRRLPPETARFLASCARPPFSAEVVGFCGAPAHPVAESRTARSRR